MKNGEYIGGNRGEDSGENPREAEMSDIICECGHRIEEHKSQGCWHIIDEEERLHCRCALGWQTVEARYERDALQAKLEIALEAMKK
jgi:hypothetical protein